MSQLSDLRITGKIWENIIHNYLGLFCIFVVVIFAGMVIVYIIQQVYDILMAWRSMIHPTLRINKLDASDLDSYPQRPVTSSSIIMSSILARKRVDDMERKYKSYNDAMKRHALRRGRLPDDIMDRRILSRNEDDYDYTDSKTKQVISDNSIPFTERERTKSGNS